MEKNQNRKGGLFGSLGKKFIAMAGLALGLLGSSAQSSGGSMKDLENEYSKSLAKDEGFYYKAKSQYSRFIASYSLAKYQKKRKNKRRISSKSRAINRKAA